MPPLNEQTGGMRSLIPWVPQWLDLNVMVPLIATVIVVAVGILVICVALTRRRDDDRGGPKDVYCRFIVGCDAKTVKRLLCANFFF
jgi:hypothetical protein